MPKKVQHIGQRVLDNFTFLKQICKTRSSKRQNKLITDASTDQLLALVEVCSNILKGQFKLSDRQKNKIIPFAPTLRKLSRARSDKGARRIVQSGGAALIPALLAPVLFHAAQHLIQRVTDGK